MPKNKNNRIFQKKNSNSNPTGDKKIKSRSQATDDIKCSSEETKSVDKNPCKDHKNCIFEARDNNQVVINYMIHTLNLLDRQIENRQINGQIGSSATHLKPWIRYSS